MTTDASPTLDAYLDRLASADPTPGGGSAAMLVAACGAALCAMVARITGAGKGSPERADLAAMLVRGADRFRERLAADRLEDERAYGAVVAAMALPKATNAEKDERTAQLQVALAGAATAPLTAAERALEVLKVAARCIELQNPHLVSDVLCAAEFAAAAVAASAANVRINHKFLKDRALIATQAQRLDALERESRALVARVRVETARDLH